MTEVLTPALSVRLAEERFQQRKRDLMNRVNSTVANLSSMGLKAVMLNTQQLIELYYRAYNPELIDTEKLDDMENMRVAENQAAP